MTREEEIQEIWEEKYKHLPQGCSDKLTLEEICYTFFEFGWMAADKNQIGNARNWLSKCASLQQEIDVLNEKLANTSVIKWQKGEPKENGRYLITTKTGVVLYDYWSCSIKKWERHVWDVLAWCKLSDIEPYKGKG